jgi:acyl-CoA synthetase (AMP-forming)/AMP-acid ligase II
MPPLFDRFGEYIGYHAQRRPDRPAFVSRYGRVLWRDVPAQVARLAKALGHAGVRRGDRVAVCCTPSIQGILCFLACSEVSAMYVGVNPRYTRPEAERLLGHAKPTILIIVGDADSSIGDASTGGHGIAAVRLDPEDDTADALIRDSLTAGEHPSNEVEKSYADDPVAIVYTSGTTGKPKGALLTQRALTWNYWHTYRERYMEWLRTPAFFPLNHLAGLGDIASLAVVAGGTQYFMERFDPVGVLELVQSERLTYLPGLVTHFQMIFRDADVGMYDLSSLEYIWWGGAMIPLSLLKRLAALCPRASTDFGQTETAGPLVYTPMDASLENKARTIGRPDDAHRVRLADPDGNVAPVGEPGELQAYGPQLSPGYFMNPEATTALYTKDGWLRTGDVAIARADGYLVMAGRIKEMYKSGGYNIYPAEIESAIAEHPDVGMVAVVSVPDEIYQEVGWAFVAPQRDAVLSADELSSFAHRRLANYKVPKRFIVLNTLPRTPVGKVDKPQLRAEAFDELHLDTLGRAAES